MGENKDIHSMIGRKVKIQTVSRLNLEKSILIASEDKKICIIFAFAYDG